MKNSLIKIISACVILICIVRVVILARDFCSNQLQIEELILIVMAQLLLIIVIGLRNKCSEK